MSKLKDNAKIIKRIVMIIVFLLFLAAPFYADSFSIIMLIRFMYFGLMTISFSFLASQLGLISLMVPVFYALVAYVIAIFQTRGIMAVEGSIFVAFIVSMAFAALAGAMVNRTKAITFLMLTLVLAQMTWSIAAVWADLTNGVDGLVGISFPDWLNVFDTGITNFNQFYWTFLLFSTTAGLVWLLTKSPYGLILRGIRESETRMKALGYNTALLKWSAFMIAAYVSSVGGLLYIHFMGMVTPEVLTLGASNQPLISSILGGINSVFAGPMIGTIIYLTLDLILSGIIRRYAIIVGLIMLFVILFTPNGLIAILDSNMGKKVRELFTKRKGGNDNVC